MWNWVMEGILKAGTSLVSMMVVALVKQYGIHVLEDIKNKIEARKKEQGA